MDYPAQFQKSANLHIKDGRHGLICIFKIDVNALQSAILILCSRFFSENPLMHYPAQFRKSANLHIQDGRHGVICRFKIDVNALRSSIIILLWKKILFLNTLWWIVLLEFENVLICISRMAAMALLLYSPIVTALAINF